MDPYGYGTEGVEKVVAIQSRTGRGEIALSRTDPAGTSVLRPRGAYAGDKLLQWLGFQEGWRSTRGQEMRERRIYLIGRRGGAVLPSRVVGGAVLRWTVVAGVRIAGRSSSPPRSRERGGSAMKTQ